MGGTIFISYRRGEDSGAAGRLYDRLEHTFGPQRLFMDVDNIPPGEDFVAVLEGQVAACDVLLALIGRGWLTATDEAGRHRLDNPDDFVRIEIASGLAQGKRVIPVLVNEAKMPRASELPEELVPLARRQAIRIVHDRFKDDAERLARTLEKVLAEAEARRKADQEERQRREKEEVEARRRAAEEERQQREKEEAEARRNADEEERQRREKEEAEARRKADEEERQRCQQEEAQARRRRAEEARQRREKEEAEARREAEEEERRRQEKEEAEARRKADEEEQRWRRRQKEATGDEQPKSGLSLSKLWLGVAVLCFVGFSSFFFSLPSKETLSSRVSSEEESPRCSNFTGGQKTSCLHKAAERGDADAQYNLGVMYYSGAGVPQDYAEAEKWYRKAADQGHPWAKLQLPMAQLIIEQNKRAAIRATEQLERAMTEKFGLQ